MLVLFLLSVISHNALNLYGAVLAVITSVQTFAYKWIPTAKARAVVSVVIFVACCYAAIGASTNFVGNLVDLVLALLVVLVPWTAINLIDFYVIHKGKYDIKSIFMVDGGIYGRFNPQALLAYAIGILVQIPFMNTPMYAGDSRASRRRRPVVAGGAVLTSPLYYWLATRDSAYRRRQTGATMPPTAVR